MSFQKKISAGEFVIVAEVNTPKGVDISELVMDARRIKGRVDAVVVPDMDRGLMRISALGGGVLMHQQGLEPIIHVCGRDRNRLALQGDILAAHVLGIRNLLVVRGEDMALGEQRDARAVDDLDELELIGAIQSLQDGVDLGGFDLRGRPSFTMGCTVAPHAYADEKTLDAELEIARKKVGAGCQFVVFPPVYDVEHFASHAAKIKDLGVPVIPMVFLIKSVGIARYIATSEPGAHISEQMIRRIRKAPDRDLECIRIAGETVSALRELAQGVQIVTIGWESRIPSILEFAGL